MNHVTYGTRMNESCHISIYSQIAAYRHVTHTNTSSDHQVQITPLQIRQPLPTHVCLHMSGELQHTATHCNTLQHNATHCNTLQHTATHCNTLQHTATHCSTLQHWFDCICQVDCNTLQHNATHCNTLQHTATHCNTLPTHCNIVLTA